MQNQFTAVGQLYVAGMSEILGMSPEAVMERCTIRELFLYAGTLASAPQGQQQAEEPKAPETIEEEQARFAAEVFGSG